MDVFRFTKLPQKANDPTRRYRLVRGVERDDVGSLEVGGDAPGGRTVLLTLDCHPVLSDAAREDALATTRRFLDELVRGWGVGAEVVAEGGWVALPDGSARTRIEYRVG